MSESPIHAEGLFIHTMTTTFFYLLCAWYNWSWYCKNVVDGF